MTTDASKGKTIEDFTQWIDENMHVFYTNLPFLTGLEKIEYLKSIEKRKFWIRISKTQSKVQSINHSFRTIAYNNAILGNVLDVQELRKTASSSEKTLLVIIQITENEKKFELADNVGIYPTNLESSIEKAIMYFKLDPSHYVWFEFSEQNKNSVTPFSSNLKVKDLLKYHIDLHGLVTFHD